MSDTPAILIIGASGGIGSALSRTLANDGYQLMLAGRDEAKLKALADEIGAECAQLDATNIDATEALAKETTQQFGRLDAIVNLAGSILLKPAHLTSETEWASVIDTNLTTAFATVRAAAKTMRRGGGSVVLMSSAIANGGFANHEAIAAAKAGVTGLAMSAAASYASSNIRFNVVAPGLVRTPLSADVLSTEAGEKISEVMHALNRVGEPQHVADMIAWLVDPTHDWVTGQVFGIDGGLGTVRPKIRI